MDKLKLEVLFGAIDKITKPLRGISDASSKTAKMLKAAKDQLKELNTAQKHADGYSKVNHDLQVNSQALKTAREKMHTLSQEIAQSENPTKKMESSLKAASSAVEKLELKNTSLEQSLTKERVALNKADIAINTLSAGQDILKLKTYSANGEIKRQAEALEQQNKAMQHSIAARKSYDKSMETRNKVAGAGASSVAAGAVVGSPVLKAIKDYASFEDAMLGVARQVNDAKDANGNYTKTYYEMGDAIKAMSEKLPLTSVEFAKIVESAARMGIQGKEDLLKFSETAAKSSIAFDLPVEELSDQMGKLAVLYKIPIKDISQFGDAINYLDDNAISKGGDIIDVLQRTAGNTAALGMKYKDAAAFASTFLSTGSSREVAGSAFNGIVTQLSIANMQTKKFKAGLKMLKLDAKGVQISMVKDPTGTIINVLEAIKKLKPELQIEASTRLFGKEYGDDASKLANNIDELHRQLKLVNAEKAKGSMDREAETRTKALSAQYELAKNSVFNLSADLGQSLKPALVEILGSVGNVFKAMRDWSKEHPALTGAIIKTLAVLAVVLVVMGSLAIAIAAVIGPMAIMKFGMSMLGLKSLGLISAIKGIGNAVLWIGRLMLMNPIGLAITGIALAAFLIYKYWDPIKAFFTGLWGDVKAAFAGGILGVSALILNWSPLGIFYKAFTGIMSWFGIELPGKFSEAGANVMHGFANGILSALSWVKKTIIGAADSVTGWFKEKLGIHSPSRVFAQLGGYTMQGLNDGLRGGQHGPLNAVRETAKKITAIGAGVMVGGTAFANGINFDNRPPINAPSKTSHPASATMQPIFNIYPSQGMNEQALAQMVAREIEKLNRQHAAAKRSSLRDSH